MLFFDVSLMLRFVRLMLMVQKFFGYDVAGFQSVNEFKLGQKLNFHQVF